MTANRLLQLYPRAWRERYGEEFIDLVGPGDLRARQVLDISMGAIDAWLSGDVHRSATHTSITTSYGGGAMLATLKAAACTGSTYQPSRRDIVMSTAVMIGGALAMSAAGLALNQFGYEGLGEAMLALAFPVPLTVSMYFSYLKNQPTRAKAAVLAITMLLMIGATFLATKI